MYCIRIITFFAMLAPLIFSNTLGQPRPKIGVAAINFYYRGKPFPIEKIKYPIHFQQTVTNVSQYIATDLTYQIKGAYVRELPFQFGWNINEYRALAMKEGLDILLFYDLQYVPEPTMYIIPPDKIVRDFSLDGRLMLLQTGETWGRISTARPGVTKAWIAKLAAEVGKAVPVWYHIRSDPSGQICCIDGEVKGLTPRDFSAFRVIGSITRVEVHFDNPKGICRRKDTKIEHREQIINETIRPRDPEVPRCQSNKSKK